MPPRGAYYAPPVLVRMPIAVFETAAPDSQERTLAGYGLRLMFIPGHWHLADGSIVVRDSIELATSASDGSSVPSASSGRVDP